MEWPEMLSRKGEVHSIVGVFRYQRIFIENFSKIAAPLTHLLKKDLPFEWTPECTQAIQLLKRILTNKPVLWQPIMNKPFYLEVDASDYTTGAVFFQKDEQGRPRIHPSWTCTTTIGQRVFLIHHSLTCLAIQSPPLSPLLPLTIVWTPV